jgi:DNA-binding transcriptional ArsR family regulator
VDSFRRLLWWLFLSSAGAATRIRIVRALHEQPRNAQQLSVALGLDYTTVRHHLKVLGQNHLLEVGGSRYGQVYFLSTIFEERWADLEAIARRLPNAPVGS